jgi:hypothetical protein
MGDTMNLPMRVLLVGLGLGVVGFALRNAAEGLGIVVAAAGSIVASVGVVAVGVQLGIQAGTRPAATRHAVAATRHRDGADRQGQRRSAESRYLSEQRQRGQQQQAAWDKLVEAARRGSTGPS